MEKTRLPTLAALPAKYMTELDETPAMLYAMAKFSAENIPDGEPFFVGEEMAEKITAMTQNMGGSAAGAKLANDFPAQVFIERLKAAGPDLKYSPIVMAWLLSLTHNVAEVVMWAYTLVEETRNRGPIGFKQLEELFPNGFPNREGMKTYWDDQKVRPPTPSIFGWNSDNRLDEPLTWRPDGAEVRVEGVH